MRLYFEGPENAGFDQEAWLAATAEHGVGSCRFDGAAVIFDFNAGATEKDRDAVRNMAKASGLEFIANGRRSAMRPKQTKIVPPVKAGPTKDGETIIVQ